MAAYFPALDVSLSGNSKLITWKLAYDALKEESCSEWIRNFLGTPEALRLLKDAIHSFPKPSSSSKSALETQTAAINVSPSHQYDVKEIKEDALWLSQEADLDEVEALRITVYEWQDRPSRALLENFSDTERASLGNLLKYKAPSTQSRRARLFSLCLEERQGLLGVCELLTALALEEKDEAPLVKRGKRLVQNIVQGFGETAEGSHGRQSYVVECIEAMQTRLDDMDREGRAPWTMTMLQELILLSGIIHDTACDLDLLKASTVLPWFRMLARYKFFTLFQAPSDELAPLVRDLQISAAMTTLGLIDVFVALEFLAQRRQDVDFYFFGGAAAELQEICQNLADIPLAIPAVYSWGLVLFAIRELSLTEDAPPIYEEVVESARSVSGDDPVAMLTHTALRDQAYEVISTLARSCGDIHRCRILNLMEVLSVSVQVVSYSEEVLAAVLAILEIPGKAKPALARSFMEDTSGLMAIVFEGTESRFPYQMLPFLSLRRALAAASDPEQPISERLEAMDTLTEAIPEGFNGYSTIREDENSNLVSLARNLHMGYDIPAGTHGTMVAAGKSRVVMWKYKFCPYEYFGTTLERYLNMEDQFLEPPDQVAVATIQLLSAVLQNTDLDSAYAILERCSRGLDRQRHDITSLVFEILELQIQELRCRNGDFRLAAACLEFMTCVIKVQPGRIWPLLSRSAFLNLGGTGSFLVGLVSMDASPEVCNFLQSIVLFYAALHDDEIARAIKRSSDMKTPRREQIVSDAPSHVKSGLFLAFTAAVAELYDNLSGVPGLRPDQIAIRVSCTRIFRGMLSFGFGLELSKLTITSSAATYVLDFFLPDSPSDASLGTLLKALVEGLDDLCEQSEVIEQTIGFCYDLLRSAKTTNRAEFLEGQLYRFSPIFVRLCLQNPKLSESCLKVLTEIVESVSGNDSLVNALGMDSSRNLLEVLSTFDSPFASVDLEIAIWKFLTAMLSFRHQWLAVYILTGSSPKRKLTKEAHSSSLRGKAFLTVALEALSKLDQIEPDRAIAILSFVCRAQEHWIWTNDSLQSHPNFFSTVFDFVSRINKSAPLLQCKQYKIASLVAQLCIAYLHHARANRDLSVFGKLLPAFKWYTKNAIQDTQYNRSLHVNLQKNFAARFEWSVADFKRNRGWQHAYGETFFYDVELAGKMLLNDESWAGSRRNPGFEHEFQLANLNLSLVDSQLQLLHSFKALCIENSQFFVRDREIQMLMLKVVHNAFTANSQNAPEKLFDNLSQTRIELVNALLQAFVDAEPRGPNVCPLLATAWQTTLFSNRSYDEAITNNDLPYYRSCLTSLFLCMQLLNAAPQTPLPDDEAHSTVLDVLKLAVAPGFGQVSRALTAQGPDEDGVGLRDFTLLLSLLQCALRLPFLPEIISQMSDVFISSTCVDAAVHLYSWAHRLAPPDTDPVYASAALSFLVSLSVLPPVAEEIGLQGILNRLITSRMTGLIQNSGGVGPFDVARSANAHRQRLYAVWSEGFLPLCLNLLHSVGRPMAGEIAAFLNQFPDQLNRASNAFAYKSALAAKNPDGSISLALAKEATTLALISHILQVYRVAGASAGVDPFDIPSLSQYDEPLNKKGLLADIEPLLTHRDSLRRRIVATNDLEMKWANHTLRAKDGSESLLEDKIAKELASAAICLKGGDEDEEP